jgi:hypothetical protein
MRRTLLLLLFLSVGAYAWAAQTLASTQAALDAQIDAAQATIVGNINTCLASADGCNTGWSCSTANYCANVDAGSSICLITQDDPGIRTATIDSNNTTCTVQPGILTFASHAFSLTPTAAMCFKSNVYSGPGGRGVQLCYRYQYAGLYYEKCRGYGPQASSFNVAWHTVTP